MRYFFTITGFLTLSSTALAADLGKAETTDISPQNITQIFVTKILKEKFEDRFGLNKAGQSRFLSHRIQNLITIAECDCAIAFAEEHRPLPWVDAGMFFDRWDTPTTCTAMPSSSTTSGVTVPLACTWGENKDHLPGTKLQVFALLVKEDGKWKIDDVVHGKQEEGGATKTTFVQRLIDAGNQSSNPRICKKGKP